MGNVIQMNGRKKISYVEVILTEKKPKVERYLLVREKIEGELCKCQKDK